MYLRIPDIIHYIQYMCCHMDLADQHCVLNFLISFIICIYRSRYSDWLKAGRPRNRSLNPGRVKNCPFSKLSRPSLRPTWSPIQLVTRDISPGVKRPRSETDHSPSTSAKVKKTWIYTCIPPYIFMV
jgi:hypothetical protein